MKERVCIAQRPLKDGVVSLFLDYRIGGKRRRENLKLYLVPERYASDKAKNAETMRIAKARRDDRAYELEQAEAGVIVKARPRLVLFRDVAKTLSERSGIAEGTRNCINKVCLKVEKCTPGVSVQECDSKWFEKVLNKMRAEGLKSNTIHTYSTIIRQVLHKAYKDGFIQAVPPFELPKFQNPIRTFLTLEELQRLDSTPFNLDVRDAFLFCCFTGLRYSDCKALTPAMIQGDTIVLRQKKTGDVVRIPLTANARKYLPERPLPNGKYFKFTYSFYVIAKMCDWARRAGIDKHITFHVSRHTFATLLITSGADVFATSKLLGHSSVETTQIYAHMVDDVRRKSVELIPSIEAKNEERT